MWIAAYIVLVVIVAAAFTFMNVRIAELERTSVDASYVSHMVDNKARWASSNNDLDIRMHEATFAHRRRPVKKAK